MRSLAPSGMDSNSSGKGPGSPIVSHSGIKGSAPLSNRKAAIPAGVDPPQASPLIPILSIDIDSGFKQEACDFRVIATDGLVNGRSFAVLEMGICSNREKTGNGRRVASPGSKP